MGVFPAVQGKGWQSEPGRRREVLAAAVRPPGWEGSAPSPPRGRPAPDPAVSNAVCRQPPRCVSRRCRPVASV